MQWLELSFQDRSPRGSPGWRPSGPPLSRLTTVPSPATPYRTWPPGWSRSSRTVAHLTVALDDTGAPVGVLGVSGHSLELFFLPPNQQGKGLGSRLFQHAMAKHYLAQITVWEANTRALGFFLRRSYRVHHRTPADPQGHPFPTLYLTLSCY